MGYMRSYNGGNPGFRDPADHIFLRPLLVQPSLSYRGNHGDGKPVGATRFLKINYAKIPASRLSIWVSVGLLRGCGPGGWAVFAVRTATSPPSPAYSGRLSLGQDLAYFLRTAGLINLGLVLLLGIFAKGGRAYCNLLCPIGAMDGLANRAGARWGRRVSVHPAKCNGCGDCVDGCPAWAIDLTDKTARIDALSCMPCGYCETACARGAIGYGKSLLPISAPRGKAVYEKG